jgi:hypothetical protein
VPPHPPPTTRSEDSNTGRGAAGCYFGCTDRIRMYTSPLLKRADVQSRRKKMQANKVTVQLSQELNLATTGEEGRHGAKPCKWRCSRILGCERRDASDGVLCAGQNEISCTRARAADNRSLL